MIAQHKITTRNTKDELPPIRYEAVKTALERLSQEALQLNASVHMPRIGCGLAGGEWEKIEAIINATLIEKGIPTYVYDI